MTGISLLYLKNVFVLLLSIILAPFVHQGLVAEYNSIQPNGKLQSMSVDANATEVASTNFASVEVNEWSPLQMTNGDGFSFGNFALIVLNTPVKMNPDRMAALWNKAEFRIAVDGGADQWYKFCKSLASDICLISEDPNIVVGNFNSIDNDTLDACYNKRNIKVMKILDPDRTDFTKALEAIAEQYNEAKVSENNEDEYNLFTFNDVLLHIVVFFACFLFY